MTQPPPSFETALTEHQVAWRRDHVSTQEPGVQNRVTYPWLLPKWAWQEGLWPPLRGEGPGSLQAYLTARRVAKHSGAHNLKSSWVSGVNLYFPFGATPAGRELLAGFLAAAVDARIRSVDALDLGWAGERELSPRTLLGETGGRRGAGQTSPDLAFSVNHGEGLVLVENKLVEHSFYRCPARTGGHTALRPGDPSTAGCDDAAGLIADPGRCHLRARGRRYWDRLREAAEPAVFTGLTRCPAATAGYQLLRQQALAEALATSGRYAFVVSAAALDARNVRLAGCLASSGLPDVRGWGTLFRGASAFSVLTHQEWAAWVRRHAAQTWGDWAEWVDARYGI